MWSDFAWYYLSFRGRISRNEFRLGFVGLVAILIVFRQPLGALSLLAFLRPVAGRPWPRDELDLALGLVKLIGVGIMWWPLTAIFVKRFHDANLSGWWLLFVPPMLFLVAVFAQFGQLTMFVWVGFVIGLCLIPGSRGSNRFGNDPLARA